MEFAEFTDCRTPGYTFNRNSYAREGKLVEIGGTVYPFKFLVYTLL
jgi:hypothetical protein